MDHDTDVHECGCIKCRLREVIFHEAGLPDFETYAAGIDGPVYGMTLMALAPTVGLFLSSIDYDDCERWWRVCLEMLGRAIDPESAGDIPEGRA